MHSSCHLCSHLSAEVREDSPCLTDSQHLIVMFHYKTLGDLKGTLLNLWLLFAGSAARTASRQDMLQEGDVYLFGKHWVNICLCLILRGGDVQEKGTNKKVKRMMSQTEQMR